MLKTVKLLFLVGTAALALSSCSVISSFVPDQEIDLMGSQELVMPETAVQSEPYDFGFDEAALKSQQTASYLPYFIIRNFDDLTESIPLNPQGLNQSIKLSKVVLSGASSLDAYPAELVLGSAKTTRTTIWDGGSMNLTGMDEYLANYSQISREFADAKTTGLWIKAESDQTTTFKLVKSETCSLEQCVYLSDSNTPSINFKFTSGDVNTLLRFIGAGGSDDPKASLALMGYFSTNIDLTGLNFKISLETPPAIAAF